MPVIHLETWISAPVQRCFDLMRDVDVHTRSAATTKERPIAGKTTGLLEQGGEVTWEAIQQTMEQAFHSIHRGGTAVMIGVPPVGMRLSIDPTLLLQERILTGTSFGSTRQRVDLPMLVDLFMDGRYKLRELISREVELEDLNDAYDRLIRKRRGEAQRGALQLTAFRIDGRYVEQRRSAPQLERLAITSSGDKPGATPHAAPGPPISRCLPRSNSRSCPPARRRACREVPLPPR